MWDEQYSQFLKGTRDTVAEWIGDDRIRVIFTADVQDSQKAYRAFKEDYDAEHKKMIEYLDSPKGRAQSKKNRQWKKK